MSASRRAVWRTELMPFYPSLRGDHLFLCHAVLSPNLSVGHLGFQLCLLQRVHLAWGPFLEHHLLSTGLPIGIRKPFVHGGWSTSPTNPNCLFFSGLGNSCLPLPIFVSKGWKGSNPLEPMTGYWHWVHKWYASPGIILLFFIQSCIPMSW